MDTPGPFRCAHCGNKTRFDVYETLGRRRFAHYDLDGGMVVEGDETFDYTLDRVVCRWCDRSDGIEPRDAQVRRRTTS